MLLRHNEQRLATKLGRRIEVAGVSARTRKKKRGIDLSGVAWFDDPVELARDDGVDVFVELIGGENGVAKEAVEAALGAGKSVVTANKALLARHGAALGGMAESSGVSLAYEAAVAAGIPIIKTLRESLAANNVARIYGILNGTCNYILTKMLDEGRPFGDVLSEAQKLGYAEADPTFDIGGYDTAHKLAILTTLAFGTEPALDDIHIEGIEGIQLEDLEAAEDLGYRIKLLGVTLRTQSGIESRVHPAMVPADSAIGQVSGVTNAVAINGDFVGDLLLAGPGAGGAATASAVAGDICDIARGIVPLPFGVPAGRLAAYTRAQLGEHQGAYYVRLSVYDRPGTMASIARRMADEEVSLESIVQRRPRHTLPGVHRSRTPGEEAPVILITHETVEAAIRRALTAIESDGKVAKPPQMIRIEKL
jgi:homoserine dehydrogenase